MSAATWEADQPVVIGSTLTGLLISHALSRHGVDHVVLGGPEPAATPRLGESMNEISSIELWTSMPAELRQTFYPKCHISLLHGDVVSMVYARHATEGVIEPDRTVMPMATTHLGRFLHGAKIIHVDRARFDPALYRLVRGQQRCRFVEARGTPVVDRASDRVVRIDVEGLPAIALPRYVFDATSGRGLIAEAAGVDKQFISDPQRVVWTHLKRRPDAQGKTYWWCHGSNIVRHDRQRDGFDGVTWLIPIGDVLSVGVSVPATSEVEPAEALLESCLSACANRGLAWSDLYTSTGPLSDVSNRYFCRSRAFGANWALGGGAFIQLWFPSSAGVGTAATAAHLAPRLVREPLVAGPIYENALRDLMRTHELLASMVRCEPFVEASQAYKFWLRSLREVPPRIINHLEGIDGPTPLLRTAGLISNAMRRAPVLQNAAWAALMVHARRCEPSQQGQAFPDYYAPARFRTAGYLRGLRLGL